MVVFQQIRPPERREWVILVLFWAVWPFAFLVQDLGVLAEKRAERNRIYECSCTKYVS